MYCLLSFGTYGVSGLVLSIILGQRHGYDRLFYRIHKMDSTKKNIEMLQQLKTAGFRIALDDFGTGYSSFQYLQTLPITTLKIDKSFIDNITQNKKTESIVRQIIEIGHEMDLVVVAEGVESKEQKDVLNSLSCS